MKPSSETPFIVYSIPGSPFGRAVLAALEEKGAPYRLAPVAPGTFRSELIFPGKVDGVKPLCARPRLG